MATRRHVRKVASGWVGCRVGVVLLLWMVVLAVPIGAATTEHVVTDRNSGLAIHGFDPVAYFTDGAPSLGKGEFEHRHAGVVWLFRNPGNSPPLPTTRTSICRASAAMIRSGLAVVCRWPAIRAIG